MHSVPFLVLPGMCSLTNCSVETAFCGACLWDCKQDAGLNQGKRDNNNWGIEEHGDMDAAMMWRYWDLGVWEYVDMGV